MVTVSRGMQYIAKLPEKQPPMNADENVGEQRARLWPALKMHEMGVYGPCQFQILTYSPSPPSGVSSSASGSEHRGIAPTHRRSPSLEN